MTFSWQAAEELAAGHMRSLGFLDAQLTRSGSDGGIDVVATGAAAQVKFLSRPVGSPDVQRLRGAAFKIDNLLFYSSSGYSPAAIIAADDIGIALFSYTVEGDLVSVNECAEALTQEGISEKLRRLRELGDALLRVGALGGAGKDVFTDIRNAINVRSEPFLESLHGWLGMSDLVSGIKAIQPSLMSAKDEAQRYIAELDTEKMPDLTLRIENLSDQLESLFVETPDSIRKNFNRRVDYHASQLAAERLARMESVGD